HKHVAEMQVYEVELPEQRKEVEAKDDILDHVKKEFKTLQAVSKKIEPSSVPFKQQLRAKNQINAFLN
ncbi:hypothetical protein ACPTFZ_15195, partial [Enterococcus faecalis]